MKDIVITNEDCRKLLARLEPESVDLVLTDPPYGIEYRAKKGSKVPTAKGIANDHKDNLPFLETVASGLYRVLKPNTHLYWFTRWDKLETHVPMLRRVGFMIKNNLIWLKGGGGMGDTAGSYAPDYECVLFGHKGRRHLRLVDGKTRHPDVLRFGKIPHSQLIHSHQKPTELLEFLIRKSTQEGDLVLDPFAGSGNVAKAALHTKRRFLGCEISEEIYELALQNVWPSHGKSIAC